MFQIFRKELDWDGKKLVLETGKIARQADGAVLVSLGDTTVLATAVVMKTAKPGQDFFPLTVNYQEKAFSAGKIPGGYFKREGRPTEKETLVSRLIDRPIRPLFVKGFMNEVQVICSVISYDMENDPDIVSMIGASAALTISGAPFMGPIGAARVGMKDENLILNPTAEEIKNSDLDLVVAGTSEGVLMVESEAKELPEELMLKAASFGHEKMKPVIESIISLAEACAKEPIAVAEEPKEKKEVTKNLKSFVQKIKNAYKEKEKSKRVNNLSLIKDEVVSLYEDELNKSLALSVFKEMEADIVRGSILKTKKRIDGRKTDTVRPIVSEVGILPKTHGSALFTRGETQALVVATLGTSQDEQFIDALEGDYRSSFMLHYNFPPFSVGEAGRTGSPGRREIGHGKLAWRSLNPVLPSHEDFPYTIRLVSEITESNGSSSMATVCGSSLALMDAGVSLPRPVAGIAMGLIKEGKEFVVLSDILGDEDHLGDMDFKVAGTKDGITSLQMDIKITGITFEIMDKALLQAKDGRIHILGEMAKALTGSRDTVSKYTPKIETVMVDKKDIAAVIGKGGATIREIVELSGAKVDVKDTGEVTVAAPDEESRSKAMNMIKDIIAKPEMNKIYTGKVMKIMEFGAFVNFLGKQDGLVHISELAPKRVAKVTDVVKEGDKVTVKVIGFDRGKVKLSIKQAIV